MNRRLFLGALASPLLPSPKTITFDRLTVDRGLVAVTGLPVGNRLAVATWDELSGEDFETGPYRQWCVLHVRCGLAVTYCDSLGDALRCASELSGITDWSVFDTFGASQDRDKRAVRDVCPDTDRIAACIEAWRERGRR